MKKFGWLLALVLVLALVSVAFANEVGRTGQIGPKKPLENMFYYEDEETGKKSWDSSVFVDIEIEPFLHIYEFDNETIMEFNLSAPAPHGDDYVNKRRLVFATNTNVTVTLEETMYETLPENIITKLWLVRAQDLISTQPGQGQGQTKPAIYRRNFSPGKYETDVLVGLGWYYVDANNQDLDWWKALAGSYGGSVYVTIAEQ